MFKKYFSERLKTLRKNAGLTQVALGKTLEVSGDLIRHIEDGSVFASAEVILRIADFFNVSIDYLYGRTDNPQISRTA